MAYVVMAPARCTASYVIAWQKFGRNEKKNTDIRSCKNYGTANLTLLEIASQYSRSIALRVCHCIYRPSRYPPLSFSVAPSDLRVSFCLVPAQTGSASHARCLPFRYSLPSDPNPEFATQHV